MPLVGWRRDLVLVAIATIGASSAGSASNEALLLRSYDTRPEFQVFTTLGQNSKYWSNASRQTGPERASPRAGDRHPGRQSPHSGQSGSSEVLAWLAIADFLRESGPARP